MNRKFFFVTVAEVVVFLCGICFSQTVPAPSPALSAASRSLDSKTECVAFEWVSGSKDATRDAIILPVQIEGHSYRFQLDTGAGADIIYGAIADHTSSPKSTDDSFQPRTLRIANTTIDRPRIRIFRDQKIVKNISGTLGLPNLIGRVTVIDYPGRRFCLFANADLPQELRTGTSVDATLRNGKLFVPVQVGDFTSDSIVFDTGSSELPLLVDLDYWRKITGQIDPEKAPMKYLGSSWGSPVVFHGAPALSELKLGGIRLGKPTVFTKEGDADGFKRWAYKVDGVMGNAAVWDGIVVLDLTDTVRFCFIY